jgi:hypothetical protein
MSVTTTRRRRAPGLIIVALAVLLAAGCSSSNSHAGSSTAPSTTTGGGSTRPNATTTSTRNGSSATLAAVVAPWRLPLPTFGEAVEVSNGSLLVIGGQGGGRSGDSNGIVVVDPATGTVSAGPTLSLGVHDAAAAILGGRLFVFGGDSATAQKVQAVTLPSGPAPVVAQLASSRTDARAMVVDGRIVIVGGVSAAGVSLTPTVLTTRDGTNFSALTQLAIPVRYAATAAVGNAVYTFGGTTQTGNNTAPGDIDAIQKIDVATGTVTVVGHLPQRLAKAVAVELGGQVFILGGRVAGRFLPQILRFDPATGAVTNAGTLPYSVTDSDVAVVNGHAYLVGGLDATRNSVATTIDLSLSAN